MKTEARVLKNTFVMTVQPLLLNVISLFAIAYIARMLGAADFGVFNLAILFSSLFYPLGILGLQNLMIRDISSIRDQRDAVREYVGKGLPLRASIILFTMVLLIVSALCMNYSGRVTQAICFAGIILAFQLLSESICDIFSGFERMEFTAFTLLVSGLTLTGLSVLQLYLGQGLFGVLGAYAVGQFLGWIVAILLMVKLISTVRFEVDFAYWKEKARKGLPFVGTSLMWAAIMRLDTLFLSKIATAENLGYYMTGMLLVTKINIIPEALSSAIYSAVANLYSRKQNSEIQSIYRKFLTLSLLFALPICVETTFFSADIISLIFGVQYGEASFILRCGIWALLLRCVIFIQFAVLAASHNEINLTKAYSMAFVCALVLNASATVFFGAPGAIVAFLGTQVFLVFTSSWYSWKSLFLQPDWKRIFVLFLLNTLLFGFLYISRTLPFLVVVFMSIPLYCLGLLLLRIVTVAEISSLFTKKSDIPINDATFSNSNAKGSC